MSRHCSTCKEGLTGPFSSLQGDEVDLDFIPLDNYSSHQQLAQCDAEHHHPDASPRQHECHDGGRPPQEECHHGNKPSQLQQLQQGQSRQERVFSWFKGVVESPRGQEGLQEQPAQQQLCATSSAGVANQVGVLPRYA